MDKLKACKKCGSNNIIDYKEKTHTVCVSLYTIYCEDCGFETTSHTSLQDAIAAWNQRADKKERS